MSGLNYDLIYFILKSIGYVALHLPQRMKKTWLPAMQSGYRKDTVDARTTGIFYAQYISSIVNV